MVTFYTVCFGVGVLMSLVSFLGGALHLHLPHRLHLPHFGHHAPRLGAPVPKGHGGSSDAPLASLNFAAMVVFLATFGGTGALLEQRGFATLIAVTIAAGVGAATSSGVNRVLRAVIRTERPLQYESYVGAIGRLIVPIREGGTGEIVFSLSGTRRCAAARNQNCVAIPRHTEVMIVRYENGIAWVRELPELSGLMNP